MGGHPWIRGRRGLGRGVPLGFWAPHQLLLNKFLDSSTPPFRKGSDGEKRKKEKNNENSGSLTSLPVDRLNGDRLQHRHSLQYLPCKAKWFQAGSLLKDENKYKALHL